MYAIQLVEQSEVRERDGTGEKREPRFFIVHAQIQMYTFLRVILEWTLLSLR